MLDSKSWFKALVNILGKLDKWLLSTYYFPGTVLSARGKNVNKIPYGVFSAESERLFMEKE